MVNIVGSTNSSAVGSCWVESLYGKTTLSWEYDHPFNEIEKHRAKFLQYELIGIGEEDVKIETEFINKTKQIFLNVKGEIEDKITGWKNDINIHLEIDTSIYNSYSCKFNNGLLTIMLKEIVNEKPSFHRYDKDLEFLPNG